ncbi:hypothetical protein GCM10029992_15580 [Glycomyces albus]
MPQSEIDKSETITERFMRRWRGEPDPAHVKAVDTYLMSAAEHGMNASTFTARVVASTGADAAASVSSGIGALSGPLHGGALARAPHDRGRREVRGRRGLREEPPRLRRAADGLRPPRLPRRGPALARAPRRGQGAGRPRYEVAEALETAALAELKARKPDRVLATNVEFWSAVLLDFAEVPAELFTPMFTCARVAGWSAHILEQKQLGRIVRPSAKYVGPGPRKPADVEGWK